MIRLFNAYFPTRTLLLTMSEAILVTSGFLLAVLLSAGTPGDARIYLLYENGAGRIGLVVLVFLLLMYYFDLYNSSILTNRREVTTRLVGVLGCTFVALAVLYYTFPGASLGGTVLWSGILMIAIAVPVWRSCFFVLNRSARFAESTAIYGDGPLAAPLMEAIMRRPELGLRIAGYVGSEPQARRYSDRGPKRAGGVREAGRHPPDCCDHGRPARQAASQGTTQAEGQRCPHTGRQ